MKKQQKKTKNLLKLSPIAMVVIVGFLVTGVASAALVNYLSNRAVTTATVNLPMEMTICEGETAAGCETTEISVTTTGLSTFNFVTVAKNLANNPVDGYRVIVIKAPGSEILTGKEFTAWETKLVGESDYTPVFNNLYAVGITGALYKLSEVASGSPVWPYGRMIIIYSDDGTVDHAKNTYAVGDDFNWNKIKATFGNITGTYKISALMVYDLTEYAASQY
ncbi:MAG: hypothetical protein WC410_02830 [Candidatus Paceibacterota bacterium]|jgi:hypothetical protein